MALGTFIKRIRDITRKDAGINGDAQRIEQLTWMLFLKIYDDKEQVWELEDDHYRSIIPPSCRWRNWANTWTDDKDKACLKGNDLLDFVDNSLFPTLKNLVLPPRCPRKKSIVKAVFADIHNYMKDGTQLREIIQQINENDFSDPANAHAFGIIYETILRELQSAGSAGEFYTPRALTDFMASHVGLKLGDTVADFACGTGGFLNSARRYLDQFRKTTEDMAVLNRSFYGIEKKPLPYLLCVTNLLLNDVEEPLIDHDNALEKSFTEYTQKDQFDVILMNPPYGGSEKADIQGNFPSDMRSSETADLFLILMIYRLKQGGRAAVVIPDGFLFQTSGNKAAIKERLLRDFNLHTIVRLPTSIFAPYTSIATNVLFFDKTGSTEKTWFYRVDMPAGYKHFSKTKPMLLDHLTELDAWWHDRKPIQVDGEDKAKAFTPEELKALHYDFDQCGFPHDEEEILPPHELIARYQHERAVSQQKVDEALQKILALLPEKDG